MYANQWAEKLKGLNSVFPGWEFGLTGMDDKYSVFAFNPDSPKEISVSVPNNTDPDTVRENSVTEFDYVKNQLAAIL